MTRIPGIALIIMLAWIQSLSAGDFVEFVSRGMSESDAIRTATVNAARMLGFDQELGTIERGKIADIIATSGNPLDDISELTRIHFVMRDGIVYYVF